MPEKILVVDDDVDTLRLVGLMLEKQGYLIVAANSGAQALQQAENENPDLILLDIMMPDMDGFEVTRMLRNNRATQNTPIIMFSAKAQVEDKVTGFEAGVDDYLTKPTQPRELVAHVKAVLARGKKPRGIPIAPEKTTPVRERGFVMGILAARGGLGVTTLTMNLGVSLRQRTSRDVVIAEFRPGEGTMALDLGYIHPEGMERLLQKKASEISITDVDAELITHKSEVRMLMSSYKPSDAKYILAAERFGAIANHLAYLGHYVLIDLGPGLPPITEKTLPICDDLIVLLEPVPYSVTRTQLLIDELTAYGFGEGRIHAVLYNRLRSELQLPLTMVQQQFKHPISVVFTPAPELAFQAARANVPLVIQHPDNLTTQQFFKLADTVTKRVHSKF
ncbi:MAG: response regulator [Anaerolineales bacterium]|jgi:pilus assembly protein CpaE|nr:response regulator [Anaerolineales bacterium]